MYRFIPRLLVVALGLATVAASAGQVDPRARIEIELRPEVTATNGVVRLGDVAYLRTTDLNAIQRLAELPLGQAPRPGTEAVMDRGAVSRWVRSQLGIASEQVSWRGAEQSRIKGSVQVLPALQIEQTARATLGQWLAQRTTRFDMESSGLRHDLNLPAGRVELQARSLAKDSQPSSRMVVWVDVSVDGAFVRTVPVSFSVEAYREAWVAKSEIATGAVLAPSMLERKEVDIASQRAAVVTVDAPTASAGLRTVRTLRAGEALNAQNAKQVSAVGRGEWVTLLLKSGVTQLEGRAEALQEGDLGQVVKVRMAGAASSVDALVVDRGRVEAMP